MVFVLSLMPSNVAGMVPAAVSELTDGVLHAMARTKLQIAALMGLTVAVIGILGGMLVASAGAIDSPKEAPAAQPPPGNQPREPDGTCSVTAAGEWVRVRVSFRDRVYHAFALRVAFNEGQKAVVLEATSREQVYVVARKGDEKAEAFSCDKIVIDWGTRKVELVGAKPTALSDRIGRVVIRNASKTPDNDVLDKVPGLRSGDVIAYPKLEQAQKNLAAFDGIVRVLPGERDDPFRDIEIAVR